LLVQQILSDILLLYSGIVDGYILCRCDNIRSQVVQRAVRIESTHQIDPGWRNYPTNIPLIEIWMNTKVIVLVIVWCHQDHGSCGSYYSHDTCILIYLYIRLVMTLISPMRRKAIIQSLTHVFKIYRK